MSIDYVVADLNNEGVSFLQEGNYREAVFALEMGLERLRCPLQKIWCHQHPYPFPFPYHHQHQHYLQSSYYDAAGEIGIVSVPIAPSPPMNNNNNNNQACSNVFEFYRKAFRIVVLSDPLSLQSLHSSTCSQRGMMIHQPRHPVTSMIVVKFNMAICYHDDGIRRNRTSHLYLALDLYQEILHLMQTYYPCHHNHHHNNIFPRGYKMLLLAVGNNMGHIHSHLMNFEQTREALYWVRHLTIQAAAAGGGTAGTFFNNRGQELLSLVPSYDDYAFFYKTVRIFTGNDLIAAPAA